MSASDRHHEVAEKIREMLAAEAENLGFDPGDIRVEDYPFNNQPRYGIAVSSVGESEGAGTNARDDIGYVTQIARVLHRLGDGGSQSRSQWRTRCRILFNRKRLGLDGCELISRVSFGQIAIPREWRDWNIDASVVRVTSFVREGRDAD